MREGGGTGTMMHLLRSKGNVHTEMRGSDGCTQPSPMIQLPRFERR